MMTDIEGYWKELLEYAQREWERSKGQESHPPIVMYEAYLELAADEQAEVDALMVEWLLSDDSLEWGGALSLIQDVGMVSAIPTLRELQARMEVSTDPEYFNGWGTVNRLLGQLSELASTEPDAGSGE